MIVLKRDRPPVGKAGFHRSEGRPGACNQWWGWPELGGPGPAAAGFHAPAAQKSQYDRDRWLARHRPGYRNRDRDSRSGLRAACTRRKYFLAWYGSQDRESSSL